MSSLIIRQLGRRDYLPVWQKMQTFTQQRAPQQADEIWWLEHHPVFTQGQAGKSEHLLMPGSIPVVQVDRGGQVTYHGPGQLVGYTLIDIRRAKISVRALVSVIEDSIVQLLAEQNVQAYAKKDAPGVYVDEKKIASLGLRIRRGCSFHGLALNVNMDLQPFERINPCGYEGLKMTQCSQLCNLTDVQQVSQLLTRILKDALGYTKIQQVEGFDDE